MSTRLMRVLIATALVATVIAAPALAQTPAAGDSNELVGSLTKELGVTPEQARGGAGSLFSLAKGKMPAADFDKVAKAVPGMDGLLGAAPAMGGGIGSLGTMAAAASAFQKLGLQPAMVSKFVPVLTNFVGSKGGADVGKLLAAALK